ncbi:cilia- and flagella-associated protein 251-like isoform X2 [Bacillus rossius redtenbacheri]|uniref:cilia- and flagella-associated protein 251-like isoform X2 n=1 Tax=Bacillus rossius redtenbacheri TaxID=93214 RepID=UPI002FDDB1F8
MSFEGSKKELATELVTDDASNLQGDSAEAPKENELPTSENVGSNNSKGKLTPFHPHWSFGFNKRMPVVNLTNCHHNVIFYTSSHLGVLYDYSTKEMELLQGHQNAVTSISADVSGRWLATADNGPDNVVIVWDVNRRLPIHTLFTPHPEAGIQLVGLSPCARFLVTVSNTSQPTVSIWLWSAGKDIPDGTCVLDAGLGDIQRITFNENKTTMFILTTEKQVIFVSLENENLIAHIPEARMTKHLGSYSESVYQPCTHQALTATSQGYVIVWSTQKYTATYNLKHDSNVKNYVKAIRLQEESITVLTSVDMYVVTGDTRGRIKFYDRILRILFWWQNFCLDSLVSISFHLNDTELDAGDHASVSVVTDTHLTVDDATQSPGESATEEDEDRSEEYDMIYRSIIPKDLSLQRKDFFVRDFVVSTESGHISLITFCDSSQHIIMHGSEQHISAMDVHPELPHLCLGNKAGRVWMYNYENKHLLISQNIPNNEKKVGVQCLKFGHSGLFLVCGMEDGSLWFLDPLLLTPIVDAPFQNTKAAITKICISKDSLFVAHKDESMCVSLYHCEDQIHHKWQYYGKQRSHYKPIRDILFSEQCDNNLLFSLGEDRTLVEYDLLLSAQNTLKIKNIERIEQSAIPLCLAWYPGVTASEEFFITANDQYKYKILPLTTKMCNKTATCPLLGSPVSLLQMLHLNSPHELKKYMMFATDTHIGIQMLPVDGNPYKALAMVAHPCKISSILCAPDNKSVFSLGCCDFSLLMWTINISSVEVMFQIGGEGLEPYHCLIEGGQSGWLFNEMKDLFYYSQILHFGENKKTERQVSRSIPLSVLPDLMRAVGYYPSEYEVENMIHEVKYADFALTGIINEQIQFEDFVRLYLNHRPATGIVLREIENAFSAIADEFSNNEATISNEKFVSILKDRGESFSQEEVETYLSVLVSQPDGTEKQPPPEILDVVPKDMNYKNFAQDILGINSSFPLGATKVTKPGITHSKNDCNT